MIDEQRAKFYRHYVSPDLQVVCFFWKPESLYRGLEDEVWLELVRQIPFTRSEQDWFWILKIFFHLYHNIWFSHPSHPIKLLKTTPLPHKQNLSFEQSGIPYTPFPFFLSDCPHQDFRQETSLPSTAISQRSIVSVSPQTTENSIAEPFCGIIGSVDEHQQSFFNLCTSHFCVCFSILTFSSFPLHHSFSAHRIGLLTP